MDFNSKKKRRNLQQLSKQPDLTQPLFFYTTPPTEVLSLQLFEEYAHDRLKVLKAVEKVGLQFIKGSQEYQDALRNELKAISKDSTLQNVFLKVYDNSDTSIRLKDNTSHFILRLAYCKTEDLRRWFINQEMDLFRFRFQLLQEKQIEEFFHYNSLNYKPISHEEKEELRDRLIDGTAGLNVNHFHSTNFYKIHFTEVLELVKSMRAYLKGGYVYVPQPELVVGVANLFRAQLSKDLAVLSRTLYRISDEPRLTTMLSNISQKYMGSEYSNQHQSGGRVTADMVDGLCKTSFPLCMQELHRSLKDQHHLKYFGRLQYGLFLKGIGLDLEEALNFWRKEFLKSMDADKFYKQYAYGIRYNYGKEGKRVSFSAYSCMKIITTNQPGVGDHHGCPFRHSDVDVLRQKLKLMMISSDGVNEITNLAKQGQCQLACGRLFELKHETNFRYVTNHPNQYFDDSQKLASGNSLADHTEASRNFKGQLFHLISFFLLLSFYLIFI
ncbi:hypothetical protein HELRODRAFT_76894 [Helobdella robusta]|uniref:DNA primase large subunit n=1 Tax=Helobdella robusta TaxID=6412 RepID=T1G2Q7_HELRO|nr:hypothetical protein HELRODRAFT_76894 [Helobdella robusta]ESO06820.1 hypothetical protein HELRODRAFT_76894 [Helobdella robusta]